MASVSDFPQERKLRQGNATGNLRMAAMRELPVVLIWPRYVLSDDRANRRYCSGPFGGTLSMRVMNLKLQTSTALSRSERRTP